MKFLKQVAAAAAGFAAFAFTAGHAAIVVTGSEGSTTLTTTNAISVDNDDLAPGSFNDMISFDVAEGLAGGQGAFDVRFSGGSPAGITSMIVTFQIEGLEDQVFEVTNGAGVQVRDFFNLQLNGTNPVTVLVEGMVFERNGQQANYNIVVAANAIPVPAAALFFGTALAGAAGLRLRKKAA